MHIAVGPGDGVRLVGVQVVDKLLARIGHRIRAVRYAVVIVVRVGHVVGHVLAEFQPGGHAGRDFVGVAVAIRAALGFDLVGAGVGPQHARPQPGPGGGGQAGGGGGGPAAPAALADVDPQAVHVQTGVHRDRVAQGGRGIVGAQHKRIAVQIKGGRGDQFGEAEFGGGLHLGRGLQVEGVVVVAGENGVHAAVEVAPGKAQFAEAIAGLVVGQAVEVAGLEGVVDEQREPVHVAVQAGVGPVRAVGEFDHHLVVGEADGAAVGRPGHQQIRAGCVAVAGTYQGGDATGVAERGGLVQADLDYSLAGARNVAVGEPPFLRIVGVDGAGGGVGGNPGGQAPRLPHAIAGRAVAVDDLGRHIVVGCVRVIHVHVHLGDRIIGADDHLVFAAPQALARLRIGDGPGGRKTVHVESLLEGVEDVRPVVGPALALAEQAGARHVKALAQVGDGDILHIELEFKLGAGGEIRVGIADVVVRVAVHVAGDGVPGVSAGVVAMVEIGGILALEHAAHGLIAEVNVGGLAFGIVQPRVATHVHPAVQLQHGAHGQPVRAGHETDGLAARHAGNVHGVCGVGRAVIIPIAVALRGVGAEGGNGGDRIPARLLDQDGLGGADLGLARHHHAVGHIMAGGDFHVHAPVRQHAGEGEGIHPVVAGGVVEQQGAGPEVGVDVLAAGGPGANPDGTPLVQVVAIAQQQQGAFVGREGGCAIVVVEVAPLVHQHGIVVVFVDVFPARELLVNPD